MNIILRLCQSEADRAAAFAVRHDVFVGEQNCNPDIEVDEYDAHALHILATDDAGNGIGTARIIAKPGNIAKIGRVAVRREHRGTGLGKAIMRRALEEARNIGLNTAVLDAQVAVIPFYESLGFAAHGGVFDDEAIPHRRMIRELTTMTSFERLRAHFPSAEKCLHVNHAGTGPAPDVAARAVQEVMDDMMSADNFTAYLHHIKRQESLRAIFARMTHTTPDTIGLVRNTSHGIGIMAQSVPFQHGQNVVVAANEYPANLYPWMAQAHRGVRVNLVPPRENGVVEEHDLIAACDAETRVLAVSSVQWGTGQRMDLRKLGDFCHAHGILLCADIVQGLGQIEYNLSDLPVDMAAAGCHKWLLAPAGVGMLYIRAGLMPDLLTCNIGWNSVANAIQWERLHFDELKPGAERFEEGSPGLLAIAALEASLSLVESTGFGNVYARIAALADTLRDGLRERGMTLISPDEAGRRTGIVAFQHPRVPNDQVLNTLKAAGVLCAVRCGNVRFSPHAYLSDDDITRVLAALPQ